jgi:hypothetical protein
VVSFLFVFAGRVLSGEGDQMGKYDDHPDTGFDVVDGIT